MGKLNVFVAVIGLVAFYILFMLHRAYDTPYDWAIFSYAVICLAWVLSDEHLERVIRFNSWIARMTHGK